MSLFYFAISVWVSSITYSLVIHCDSRLLLYVVLLKTITQALLITLKATLAVTCVFVVLHLFKQFCSVDIVVIVILPLFLIERSTNRAWLHWMRYIFWAIHAPEFPPDLVFYDTLASYDLEEKLIVYVSLLYDLWIVEIVFSQVLLN